MNMQPNINTIFVYNSKLYILDKNEYHPLLLFVTIRRISFQEELELMMFEHETTEKIKLTTFMSEYEAQNLVALYISEDIQSYKLATELLQTLCNNV